MEIFNYFKDPNYSVFVWDRSGLAQDDSSSLSSIDSSTYGNARRILRDNEIFPIKNYRSFRGTMNIEDFCAEVFSRDDVFVLDIYGFGLVLHNPTGDLEKLTSVIDLLGLAEKEEPPKGEEVA